MTTFDFPMHLCSTWTGIYTIRADKYLFDKENPVNRYRTGTANRLRVERGMLPLCQRGVVFLQVPRPPGFAIGMAAELWTTESIMYECYKRNILGTHCEPGFHRRGKGIPVYVLVCRRYQ
jgi:hypothetical protein